MNKYLKQLIEARKKKLGEINVLMTKALDAGETPDEETETSIADLEAQIAEIEKNIERVKAQIEAAKEAEAGDPEVVEDTTKTVTKAVKAESNLPKGMGFTLAVKAAAAASRSNSRGMHTTPVELLKSWNAPQEVINFVTNKAVIGTTTDANFASALVDTANLTGEFVELLRPKTILGKLSGFREVPFNVKIPVQNAGSTVNWVGEAAPKPTTDLGFSSVTLTHSKIAGIVLLSDELLRFSNPKADGLIMNDLQREIAQFTDEQFVDPAKVEAVDSPASIINGIAPIPSSGTSAAQVEADLMLAITQLVTAGESLDGAYWLMSETRAAQYSILRDALGNPYFNGMGLGLESKSILGIPVVTSESVGNKVILVKPSNILLADDGEVDFAISQEATITNGEQTVNLFQNNLSAIRAERYIRWKPVRTAAAWINYDPAG